MIPNQILTLQTNQTFEKTSETMRIKVLLLLLLVTISTSMFAQVNLDRENAPVIRELNSYLNTQGAAQRTAGNVSPDARNLENLIFKNQSAVYFYSGNTNTYGDKPKNLYSDLSSLKRIASADFLKDNIEIVIVSIKSSTDLNGNLDMSLLSSLKKLKYVYFVCEVNASESNIARIVSNSSDKYSFYFKVENKS